MAKWKALDEMTYLGRGYSRVDGPGKTSGAVKYTHDLKLPGMLYGALLSSPYAAARIKRLAAGAAQALPGVKAVLTDVHPTGTVRYAGEEVAAVAAVSPEIAAEALDLIKVEYELLPFVVDLETAMADDAPRVYAEQSNRREARVDSRGDLAAGFAQAAVIVEGSYRTQVQVHACLEVHGSVAKWEGDELIVWDSTQGVYASREGIAKFLNIEQSKVRVICDYMGGGFGSKLQAGRYSAIAARLARAAGAPVKLMLTRPQDSISAGNRPNLLAEVKAGATRDGKLIAFSAKTYGTAGIGNNARPALPLVYEVPNSRVEHYDVYTNAGAARAFRAPGCPQASFVMEQVMDELAERLNLDPLDFRLRNDSNPTRQQQWRMAAERFGWSRRAKRPNASPGGIKRGMGLGAAVWWPGGRGTQAQMTILPDGGIEVRCGTQDIGTGTRTFVAAVAAEELGVPIASVKAMIGDTEYPYSGASGGSTTAPSVAPAIKNVAEKARDKLAELAARHFGVASSEVQLAGGRAFVRGNPQNALPWKQLCALLGSAPLVTHGEWAEGLSSAGVAGCQFAEVEVDTETGVVTVLRILAVQDCGLVLNRLTAESQVIGGVVQGLSYALYEDRLMDPLTGVQINPTFENYKIIGALEMPKIEVIIHDQPGRGVIGIGEPPTIPTAAAIANAVYHATGKRPRELPMTPERVLAVLHA
ncbi:MAG: xanthine dehydrogenase family protein molybdopterin-binding subunit [candidate division KSB1 bacterium]|nr:xanthine dehydrogenase family protein molybdopterin-binding subunit [candidate division KSB1 bacterium]MDZ7273843.1 xanthine dehydrogenase family protein molybdopterin-binding subunit [candidate division KSB1 bacterium]MDZ7285999.1 xanthine dehydrogenase family protein molybdopterin-binding subunit [candidate division KSB1 bacterium]MDZ7299031.1 xanthine dehydrogenase family protein molybdopterin-binding subunit [candidate division KSB1 bacterium]MDZ7307998.1 xanthine dehydrogenase family pr